VSKPQLVLVHPHYNVEQKFLEINHATHLMWFKLFTIMFNQIVTKCWVVRIWTFMPISHYMACIPHPTCIC